MPGVSDRLRAAAQPLWQAQLEHPFVRGIADGSLEAARFSHFVKQDYLKLFGNYLADLDPTHVGPGHHLDHVRGCRGFRKASLFLIEYARVLAFACARAPRLSLMQRFAHLAQVTLTTEMDLHRGYAEQCAIPAEELEREPMTPTTRAY